MHPASFVRLAWNPISYVSKGREFLCKDLPSISFETPKKVSVSLKGRVKQVGSFIYGFLSDSLLISIMLHGSSLISKIGELGHHRIATTVPYLSIATAPLHLYHAFHEVYARSKLTAQALWAGQYSEASFLAGATLTSLEGAIGAISSALAGTTEIAGLSSQVPYLDSILLEIVPILATASGALRALLEGWRIKSSINNLSELNRMIREAQGDLSKLTELFNFLIDDENKGDDPKAKIRRECFVKNHFTNPKRFEELKQVIETLGGTIRLSDGEQVLRLAKSDHHRQVLYHTIALTLALLAIVAGVLYLTSSQHQILAMSLWAAGASLDIALIIFDKKVSMNRYADLEDWFTEKVDDLSKMLSEVGVWSLESYGPLQMNEFFL